MLTSYQAETIAVLTDGGFICLECAGLSDPERAAEQFDLEIRPMSRYELDEYQSESAYDWRSQGDNEGHCSDCECAPAVLCDSCGEELIEDYVWSLDCDEQAIAEEAQAEARRQAELYRMGFDPHEEPVTGDPREGLDPTR